MKRKIRPFQKIAGGALFVFLVFLGLSETVSATSRGITLEAVPKTNTALDPSTQGIYRALVIGNNDYANGASPWKKLKTAVNDARAVSRLLRNYYGFTDVRLLENASRRDVLLALHALSQRVLAHDSVLVYYAGHGYLDTENQRGYWVPVDAKGRDHTTFLRNSTIRDELITIADRARHTLLISDSCFSGTLLRSGSRGVDPDIGSERYYQKVANKKSVQILSAGGIEYVEDNYKNSGHSPFTYFLLNELKTNNRPLLTFSELSTQVEKAVANNAEQVPESGVLHGAGDELGEFIFMKVEITLDGLPKEKVKIDVQINEAQKDNTNQADTPPKDANSPPALQKKDSKRMRPLTPLPTF